MKALGEHIKIVLTQALLWGLIDGYIYGLNPNFFLAKFVSLIVIIKLMPLLFYGYKLLTIKDIFYLDILIFYVVIFCSQYISCIGTYIILACYMLFTLMPIKNFLFKDPITNKYGFKGHTEIINKKQEKWRHLTMR